MNKSRILQLANTLFENEQITRNALTFLAYSNDFYDKVFESLSVQDNITEENLLFAINQHLILNKKNVYAKDEFCSIMNEIKNSEDFDNQINSMYRKFNDTFKYYEFDFSYSNISMPAFLTIKVLCKMFEDVDDSEIEYFVYECDWGRDTKWGDIFYELNDTKNTPYKVYIDFSSLENLYDYLIFKMNGFKF